MSTFFKFNNNILKWVFNDLVYPNLSKFLLVILLDILGLLCQIAAYGLLLKYANAMEQSSELHFLGQVYVPESSQRILTVVAIGTGVLFLLNGVFDYWSKIKSINMTKTYDVFCSDRIVKALSSLIKNSKPIGSEELSFDNRRLRKAIVKDARFCGKLINIFTFGLITSMKFIGSLVFMFSVNYLLTLVILIMVIPIILLLMHNAKKVVNLTQARETKLSSFIYSKKVLMEGALKGSKRKKLNNVDFDPSKETSAFYNLYYSIYKKLALSDLIIVLFIAVLTIVIVSIAGNLVLFDDMALTIFIAYIVALRYFFGSLKSLNGTFKKSSKTYDYVCHYVNTLEQIQTAQGVPALAAYTNARILDKESDRLGLDLDNDDEEEDDDDDL